MAQRVMFYYFMCGERYRHFRGKKVTLPVVLDSDLHRLGGSLCSMGDLERLRVVAQNRAQWKVLTKRVVGSLSQQQGKRHGRKRKRKEDNTSSECVQPVAKRVSRVRAVVRHKRQRSEDLQCEEQRVEQHIPVRRSERLAAKRAKIGDL
jgi:hypothetical protein